MKTRWIAVLLLLCAFAAFAAEEVKEFDVRVTPTLKNRWLITVRIPADDGIFTAIADLLTLPGVQTITSTRGAKSYTVTIYADSMGMGKAELAISENGTVVSRTERPLNGPIPLAERGDYQRLGMADGSISPPVAIQRVEPEYPADARAARVQGIVIIEAKISDQGEVTQVRLLRPLGMESIDRAALDAVKQWKFRPAMRDGQPIDVIFNLTINFRLPELPRQ